MYSQHPTTLDTATAILGLLETSPYKCDSYQCFSFASYRRRYEEKKRAISLRVGYEKTIFSRMIAKPELCSRFFSSCLVNVNGMPIRVILFHLGILKIFKRPKDNF